MQKFGNVKLAVVMSIAFVGAVILTNLNKADARPQYVGAFSKKYSNLADQVKKKKCGVCHPEKKKKVRNDYGNALGKALGKKNQKDKAKIAEALGKVEKEKSSVEGKTFGDLIKADKLPGDK